MNPEHKNGSRRMFWFHRYRTTRFFLLMLIVAMAFLYALDAACTEETSPADEYSLCGRLLYSGYYGIKDVTYETPHPEIPTPVTVEFNFVDPNYDGISTEIQESYIHYILNNDFSTYQAIPLECKQLICTGAIPAQPAGTTVTLAISVKDTIGNVSIEAFQPASSRSFRKALLVSSIENDDTQEDLPDGLDIIGLKAAFDERYVYFQVQTQGAVSEGTVKPPFFHTYMIKFSNPDIDPYEGLYNGTLFLDMPYDDSNTREKAFHDEFVRTCEDCDWFSKMLLGGGDTQRYSKEFGEDGLTGINLMKFVVSSVEEGVVPSEQYLIGHSEGYYYGAVERSVFGDNSGGMIRMIALTGSNDGTYLLGSLFDCSHYLQLYLRNHEFRVD